MANKKFYSFYLNGEPPENKYQIEIKRENLSKDPIDSYRQVELRKDLFITLYEYDLCFRNTLIGLDVSDHIEFLEFHKHEYKGENADLISRINVVLASDLNTSSQIIATRFKRVKDWIDSQSQLAPKKLIWKGTPSQFGYIFHLLEKNGFIEAPKRDGKTNNSQYAKNCWELFEFDSESLENLEKELRKSSLTFANKELINIPRISEIS